VASSARFDDPYINQFQNLVVHGCSHPELRWMAPAPTDSCNGEDLDVMRVWPQAMERNRRVNILIGAIT